MNKKSALLLFLTLSLCRLPAQDLNRVTTDPKSGTDMLIGYCNRDGLTEGSFGEWFTPEYDNYVVDHVVLNDLNQDLLLLIEITVVLGTWCSDSQREIPRFIKIMDELGYEANAINMICVDRTKQTDTESLEELKIERVPTIIFSMEGEELGRIIETPQKSLEADMVQIFNK
jgi:thiol-disulfide isomerase/thioredoxin